MGNILYKHYTRIFNNYGKQISVVITHPNGHNEPQTILNGEVCDVATNSGTVTITLYDPEVPECRKPVEQRRILSNINVMITKTTAGKPKIVRVISGSTKEPDPKDNQ